MKCFLVMGLCLFQYVFAAKCPDKMRNSSLGEVYNQAYSDEPAQEFDYQKVSSTRLSLTEEEFAKIPVIGTNFSFESCKNAIRKIVFEDIETGEKFTAYHTFEDSCDGGNSNGSIFNEQEEQIATIDDSDFYCLESLEKTKNSL